jgi:hypothetical protein
MNVAVVVQVVLLVYHQVTTLFDFFPFNGARNYSRTEKIAECGTNAVLMSIAPIGFGFGIAGCETFGVYYYYVLFALEMIIWWIPYFCEPRGVFLRVYNLLLAIGTSDFPPENCLARWKVTYERLHRSTWIILPPKGDRPVPNVEHTILHLLTLITLIVTTIEYFFVKPFTP